MTWTLYIGNKAYSSWSLRPWILLRQFEIDFDETVIPLYEATSCLEIQQHSPTGKVPALVASDVVVWDSLAIIEYVADCFPNKGIWPSEPAARAMARALSAEMHAGFADLRRTCPTNFRRKPKPLALNDEARRDVDRIEAAWAAARRQWGQSGPFLFGGFSGADAMFAPVVNRLHAYAVEVTPETRTYMDAIMALPEWQAWIAGAEAEPWTIERWEGL